MGEIKSTRDHAFHTRLVTCGDERLFAQITLPFLGFLGKDVAGESFFALEPARTGYLETLLRATV